MKNVKVSLVSVLYMSTGDTVQVEIAIHRESHSVEVRDRAGRLLFERSYAHSPVSSLGPEEIGWIMSQVSHKVREALDD